MLRNRYVALAIVCLVAFFTACVAFAASTAPAAYIYVASNYSGTATRIVGYAAAPNGQLTPVPGSPITATVGSLAANGKYLFASPLYNSASTDIDSFRIGSNGSLNLANTTDVSKFPGLGCASPYVLALDRSGATLYPYAFNIDCSAGPGFLSLNINPSTGGLTYLSTASGGPQITYFGLTFTGNNSLAYEANCIYEGAGVILAFQRQSDGSLVSINENVQFPPAQNENENYCPSYATADSGNHMAVDEALLGAGSGIPDQIASYTVNEGNGDVTTNSMYANMPQTAVVSVRTMAMDPSGKLLAVGGTKGLQIFHFNGADPATVDTGLLTSDEIDQVFWDNASHVYAISTSGNTLRVFTMTDTGASEAPGSPYTIPSPQFLAVQSQACSAPGSPGVNICQPASGSTVGSPVSVEAAATVTGTLANVQLWVDGTKKYTSSSTTLNTSISLPAGTHRFAVVATNSAGQKWESAVDATVTSGGACSAPSSAGVNICAPANGSSVSSPVQVTATATVSGTIANTQLWVDGVKKYSTASSSLNTSISLSAGTHRFAVVAANTAGQKWENAINATVK